MYATISSVSERPTVLATNRLAWRLTQRHDMSTQRDELYQNPFINSLEKRHGRDVADKILSFFHLTLHTASILVLRLWLE